MLLEVTNYESQQGFATNITKTNDNPAFGMGSAINSEAVTQIFNISASFVRFTLNNTNNAPVFNIDRESNVKMKTFKEIMEQR
jgi:hypothetical protein